MEDTPRPNVLIVDDEPALADGHAAQLEGYDVRTANSGPEALETIDASVDVVLLDRRMPGMCGDSVLEHLRDRGVDSRIVMLTGVEPTTDVATMGFDDYLRKPVSREALRATVDRMYRRAAYDERLQRYYSLASRRATLETHHARSDLLEDPQYRELCRRLRSVRDELDDVIAELPEEDWYVVATDEPVDTTVDAGAN